MQQRIPILAYHALLAAKDAELPAGWSAPHAVTLDAFQRQLQFMRAEGWASILPDEIGTVPRDNKQRCFILTFDDGHRSDLLAATFLHDAGYRSAFYIPYEHIDRQGFLRRSDIKLLAACGFAIGSHGLTHTPFTRHSDGELRNELRGSREKLEDLIGAPVWDLAVPFGRYDRRVIKMARDAGYQRIMTSDVGLARTAEAGVYPRLPVTARTTTHDFQRMVSSGLVGVTVRRWSSAFNRRLELLQRMLPFRRRHHVPELDGSPSRFSDETRT